VKLWAAQLIEIADTIEQSPIAKIIEEFQRHQNLHRQKLETYHQIAKEFYSEPEQLSIAQKYRYLVLRRGIRYEEDYIAWCNEVLELFANHADAKGI
jgi:predicted solute-binding protein